MDTLDLGQSFGAGFRTTAFAGKTPDRLFDIYLDIKVNQVIELAIDVVREILVEDEPPVSDRAAILESLLIQFRTDPGLIKLDNVEESEMMVIRERVARRIEEQKDVCKRELRRLDLGSFRGYNGVV